MLGLCIFIHELGHYTFGRMVGVKAQIFSIGYGRGLWKKKIGDTTWQVTAFPIGGYVKFYGDDIHNRDHKMPGGFFTVSPLRRMIPVIGGPLFNLFFGFLLFLLLHSLSGPLAPRIAHDEDAGRNTPAKRAGLQDGDIVHSINSVAVHSFTDIVQIVALSEGQPQKFTVLRDKKSLELEVIPDVTPSGTARIGIRIPGKRYLQVSYPDLTLLYHRLLSLLSERPWPANIRGFPRLQDGDTILSVEGKEIYSVTNLQEVLGQHHGQTVSIHLKRERLPWLAPWPYQEMSVEVPTMAEYLLEVEEIKDLHYNTPISETFHLYSAVEAHQRGLNYIQINGEASTSFQVMFQRFALPQRVLLDMNGKKYQATIQVKKTGTIGFRPNSFIEADYLSGHLSIGSTLGAAINDLWNNIALYPSFIGSLFSGRISFFDNAAGPLRIFGAAGIILKAGLHNYLQLFAAISIALFVMNLIPLPVLDGGHIAFFLYEAIAGKPLSVRVLALLYRLSFTLLVVVGLFILYQDLLWLLAL